MKIKTSQTGKNKYNDNMRQDYLLLNVPVRARGCSQIWRKTMRFIDGHPCRTYEKGNTSVEIYQDTIIYTLYRDSGRCRECRVYSWTNCPNWIKNLDLAPFAFGGKKC